MCGIAGIFHFDRQRAVDRQTLERMTRTLIHRGPDDEGFFVEGPVGFGARRLSIVDRAHGHQPLCTEDGRIWIAFNGEIYNHPDLSCQLQAKGHVYRTHCDTETAAHGFEEYGEKVAEHLRGMFAFAIWDSAQQRMCLFRDRLGIKPLYYARLDRTLVFASEVKALLEYGVPFEVEDQVMECYFRLGYVPGERTMFRGIYKLLPGHYLVAQAGEPQLRIERYWSPPFSPEPDRDEKRTVQEFEALLEETVADHRLGEVPQGIFLSGGVDSSSLLALTAGQVQEQVLTFSVGYEEHRETNEFPFARRVADQYKARHFEFELSGKNFAEWLPKLIWHMDEPVADQAAIPLFFIARLAREHITVVHSGEGADEILAGYGIYKKMAKISALQRVAGKAGAGLVAGGLRIPGIPKRLRHYAEMADQPLAERYQGVRRVMTEGMLKRITRNGFLAAEGSRYRKDFYRQLFSRCAACSELDQMLSVDQQGWLPDDLLIKADKMTMAASIELRVPFLDHRVVEFAGRLPAHFKIRRGTSKYLLKTMMRKRLPGDILDATKRGFPTPLASWLRQELNEQARSWLLDSRFLSQYFLRDEMAKLLDMHKQGQADLSGEIYSLACLHLWHQTFGKSASG